MPVCSLLAALGVWDVQERQRRDAQRELAKLRPKLFYEEQKRRHMNKIKSKSYRKIRKKQKVKIAMAERDRLRLENPDEAARLDEEDAMQHAKERMTLRHRNKGKWARRVLKTGGTANEAVRAAVNEHVLKSDELKQRMQRASLPGSKRRGGDDGADDDDDDDDDDLSSSEDGGSESEDSTAAATRSRRRARRAVLKLSDDISKDAEELDADAPTKGLFR